MTISLPQGYELPDNALPGEPFEAVATLTQNEDGTFELSAIDGMEIPATDAVAVEAAPSAALPWNQPNPLEKV